MIAVEKRGLLEPFGELFACNRFFRAVGLSVISAFRMFPETEAVDQYWAFFIDSRVLPALPERVDAPRTRPGREM